MPKCKHFHICRWKHLGTSFIIAILYLASFSDARSKLTGYQSILCADQQCREPISEGVTTTIYPAPEKILLSFKKDLNIRIFGKTGDKNFYFVEANERRGFVPAKLVKETRVLLDEAKLNDVIFDFVGFEKSLDSVDEKNGSVDKQPVLSSSDQIPNDNQSGTATPFVYTQKLTVIDGTTIDEDLMVVTATPSPTFVANPVTKTATIEANFTGEKLDRETVVRQESELGKDRGSIINFVKGVPVNSDITRPDDFNKQVDPGTASVQPSSSSASPEVDNENKPPVVPIENDKSAPHAPEVTNTTASQMEIEESITIESFEDTEETLSADDVIDVSEVVAEKNTDSKVVEKETGIKTEKSFVSQKQEQEVVNDANASLNGTVGSPGNEEASHKVDDNVFSIIADTATANVEQQNETAENVAKKDEPVAKGDNISQSQKINDSGVATNPVDHSSDPVAHANTVVNSPSTTVSPIQQTYPPPPSHHIHKREIETPVIPPSPNPRIYPQNPNPNVPPIPNSIPESAAAENDRPDTVQNHPHRRPLPDHLKFGSTGDVQPNRAINNVQPQHQYPDQSSESPYQNQHRAISPKILPQPIKPDHSPPNLNPQDHAFPTPNIPVAAETPLHSVDPKPPIAALVDDHNLSSQLNVTQYESTATNSNIAKRKLLAERVEFVSVIMDIIPDEVELFFESFNILLHAVIVTSIVAFFWCLAKVFVFFICSSKKVRELRDVICQTQRKLYYLEAEKDKLKEEHINCGDEFSNYKHSMNKVEKRKFQLEQENEKLKNEILAMKKENLALADSNPKISSQLNSVQEELEQFKQENRELNFKIDELEIQIQQNMDSIKNYEKIAKSDKEEIDNLNRQLISLNEANEKLNETLQELEKNFETLESDNTNLKELQSKRNDEIKYLKDELLCSQEKVQNLENDCKSLESQLKLAKEKISTLSQELEIKNAEIISMQALLTKLNKNMNNEQIRPKRSHDLMQQNGDLSDNLNGNDDSEAVDVTEEFEDLQNVLQLQLRLTQLECEKDQYKSKYEAIQKQIDEMAAEVEAIKKMNEQLKQEIKTADAEKTKAVMELEVLTKYYKEKELEYAKDIGVHKVKQEQQSEDVTSLTSKLEVIQEENTILKDQLKSTRKELEETERRFKSQLNQLEKQSHENWIAARAAERRYEEANAEASALRQTLTKSVKSPPPGELSFGYLDISSVSGGSVGSIPEMLNNSVPVPPPPPPPPPFLGMFGAIPPPPMPPTGPAMFDHHSNGSNNVNNTLWAAPASATSVVSAVTSSQPVSSYYDSSRSNMVPVNHGQNDSTYSHASQSGGSMMPQPYIQTPNQSQQQGGVQYSSNPYHQYSSGHHDYNIHHMQEMTRNTYSPMSQLSTNTPLTSLPAMVQQQAPPAYSMAPGSSHVSMSGSQYPSGQSNMAGSVGLQSNDARSSNPYSIQTTDYTTQNYQSQPSHQNAYSMQNPVAANHPAPEQQFYNPQGQQQERQQPVIDPNVAASYYGHQQQPPPHQMAPQQPNHPVKQESDSRPVSVHSQMV